jgi:D-threonate/D-erythronate kinase
MIRPQLAIVADDLTGAADTAGCFAGGDLTTAVPLCSDPFPPVDVLSLSTECRDIEACDIEPRVQRTLDLAIAHGQPDRWYKKIDSVLRGHPGFELAAMMAFTGLETAIVAPALPAEGRTTIEGRVYVHGLPLHTTNFAGSTRSSSIVERLRSHIHSRFGAVSLATVHRGPEAIRRSIAEQQPSVIVVDATTLDDLIALARAVTDSPDLLLCGAAGFAMALEQVLSLRQLAPAPPDPVTNDRPVLIVAGSRHQATAQQIERAANAGIPVFRPDHPDDLANTDIQQRLRAGVLDALRSGSDAIVTITGTPSSRVLGGHDLARQLAGVLACEEIISLTGGLVMTGGDVAAAVCDRFGSGFLWIRGEVLPAMPWGTFGTGTLANRPFVTKAGSFGIESALVDAVAHLRTVSRHPA